MGASIGNARLSPGSGIRSMRITINALAGKVTWGGFNSTKKFGLTQSASQ
jgi:hypothetical protein